jgi:undecaprenyl diphosphate synthase
MAEAKPELPVHVGLIVDGNRRWARDRGLPSLVGHRRGFEAIKKVADELFERGVKYVSAYIFSVENWNRDKAEVSYLMDLAYERVTKDIDELNEKNIRLGWLGRRERVPAKVMAALDRALELTKANTKGTLALCFNYGGQQEIVDAVNRLMKAGKKSVTEEDVSENLYTPELPPVDIMVRTSGEQRLSNFMLWRMPYGELMFIKKHFPAMTKRDARAILTEYASRQRRFGK